MVLFVSCDFFFTSPFPQDLVYYDKSVNVMGSLAVPPEQFFISTIGNIGILQGIYSSESSALCRLVVFDSSLNILYNDDYQPPGTFSLVDANGRYVIGDRIFNPDMSLYGQIPAGNLPPVGLNICYGYAYSGSNYIAYYSSGKITITQYSNSWSKGSNTTIQLGSVSPFQFRSNANESKMIQYNIGNDGVIFFIFDPNDSNSVYESLVWAGNIASGGTITIMDTAIVKLNINNKYRYSLYTEKGFIVKDWNGIYKLFSKDDGSFISEKQMYTSDSSSIYDTVEVYGNDRYVFNAQSKFLFHSKMWW
jgi:hypothetical protein